MARKGLGKGLDSLIPDFYNEDFDSNSPQSLEDMLKENQDEEIETSEGDSGKKNIFDEIEEENKQKEELDEEDAQEVSEDVTEGEETHVVKGSSEDISGDIRSEDDLQTSQEIEIQKAHVAEVKEIVDKNPRITLWSSRSSAVFRYLRKTEPEFSISKEASILIEEAVSKKYPEIWALFDDY